VAYVIIFKQVEDFAVILVQAPSRSLFSAVVIIGAFLDATRLLHAWR